MERHPQNKRVPHRDVVWFSARHSSIAELISSARYAPRRIDQSNGNKQRNPILSPYTRTVEAAIQQLPLTNRNCVIHQWQLFSVCHGEHKLRSPRSALFGAPGSFLLPPQVPSPSKAWLVPFSPSLASANA